MSIYQILFSSVYSWFKLFIANHVKIFVALKGNKCYYPCSYFWFEIMLIHLHILLLNNGQCILTLICHQLMKSCALQTCNPFQVFSLNEAK
jgi:hypothetical protein